MTGPLPFARSAQVKVRPSTILEEALPCTIWPTGSRMTTAGVAYDHEGEAPLDFYGLLREPNRVLVLDGEEYVVVDCQQNVYLPHVAMVLRRARPAGA